MSTNTTIVEAIGFIKARLDEELPLVTVSEIMPEASKLERKHIWLESIDVESSVTSFKQGRKRREESYELRYTAYTNVPGQNAIEAIGSNIELCIAFDDVLADHANLDMPGKIIDAVLQDYRIEQFHSEKGIGAATELTVKIRASLT